MLVSTKGRYALRVMLELAQRPAGSYTPLPVIAEKQSVSEKYLESIVVLLSRAGLVDGVRGKGGGYRLTRTPAQYSVGEILRLTEGRWRPSPVWRGRRTPAPGPVTATPCPCGRSWTASSTAIWTAYRWPISCGRPAAAACKAAPPTKRDTRINGGYLWNS